jgi:hypothetical protein
MRYLLTSLITAAICIAITSTIATARPTDNRFFHTIRSGETAYFPSADLACEAGDFYYGKSIHCYRYSGPLGSRHSPFNP